MQPFKMINGYNPGKRINIKPPTPGAFAQCHRTEPDWMRLFTIYRGSRSPWKSSTASGVFQPAGFAKLLRLVPLSGTQPRSDVPRSSNLHRLGHIAAIN
jgi:hypothetical protein